MDKRFDNNNIEKFGKKFERILKCKASEKVLLLLMAFAFIFLLVAGTFAPEYDTSQNLENQYPGLLRFHVVANSNSDEDQELKLKVRDYILQQLHEQKEVSDIEDMKLYISSNLNQIETWAKEGLAKYDSAYDCTASLGIRHIPAKYYDDILFPEGNYEALTITIGEGKGENWWCVVFPPLCLVDSEEDGNSTYTGEFDMDQQSKIQLRSKIKEMMDDAQNSDGFNQKPDDYNQSASITSILKGIYSWEMIDAFLFC